MSFPRPCIAPDGGRLFADDDAPSSEWLCIAELQDLIASDVITEETALFTERFDSFMPLSKVSEDHPDFEGAISSDYYQSMIYVNDAQEESEEIDAEAIRTAVRSGELVDTNMCWAPGARATVAAHWRTCRGQPSRPQPAR